MSVRRLADISVQPPAFAFNRAMQGQVKTWIKKYPKGRQQSAVIPLLMLAQEQEGWVTKAAIEHVADTLAMPHIRVLEVATFYTQFQLKPVGTRAHVQVCGTTPCQLMGSEALMDVCRSKIHHDQFHTNADGTLSWEEVECLGACVNAPMVMIFKDTYEDLTPERLAKIIDEFEAGRGDSVPTGPQIKRVFSAPAKGLTSLRREKDVLKGSKPKAAAVPTPVVSTTIAPSKAARPKTDAIETSPAINSPSTVKASPNGERAASVAAPQAQSNPRVALVSQTPEKPLLGAARVPSATAAPARKAANDSAPAPKKVIGAAEKKEISAQPLAPVETPLQAPKPARPAKARLVPLKEESKPVVGKLGKAPKAVASPVQTAPAVKPTLDSVSRPKPIERPRVVDDLKLISGVGPKIERTLHDLGIFTFAQIARWTKAECDWADGFLDFRGRVEGEDWVRQAAALAKGGIPEYVRVFGRKPV